MKHFLICPGERAAVRSFARDIPPAQIPLVGQSLLEHWVAYLACAGEKEIAVLTIKDHAESLAAFLGDGARWGMHLAVIPESRELTPAEVQLKYDRDTVSGENGIILVDHFPGCSDHRLFDNHAALFAGICAWMPRSTMPDHVGVHELLPGAWGGLHEQVSPSAQINAPCWIGRNAIIGPRAIVGPYAVIEDRSVIEADAQVVESYVGPDTFVGRCTALSESIAWGSTLLNWKTGSLVEIQDAFILCALRRYSSSPGRSLLERVSELCAPNKDESALFLKDILINKEGSQ